MTDPYGGPGQFSNQWEQSDGQLEPSKSSGKTGTIAAVIGVIAVIALVAAGVWYFLSHRDGDDVKNSAAESSAPRFTNSSAPETTSSKDSESESSAPSPSSEAPASEPTSPRGKTVGDCSASAAKNDLSNPSIDTVSDCDGQWMIAGKARTDMVIPAYWDGTQWQRYQPDGETDTSFDCYDEAKLKNAGAPQEIRNNITLCRDSSGSSSGDSHTDSSGYGSTIARTSHGTVSASAPQCDGRYILIMDSPMFYENDDGPGIIGKSLDQYPGAEFTTPGKCPSLRASLDGASIFPVYYDFGHNVDALCEAAATRGGDARQLNTTGEFINPC